MLINVTFSFVLGNIFISVATHSKVKEVTLTYI